MLEQLFGSRVRARLLAWLLTRPHERYYVRQLESVLDEDSTNISRQLARLAGMGILTYTVEGRQKYYQANVDSPLFADLQGLVIKTDGTVTALREALSHLAGRIDLALVYGASASPQAMPGADLDVLVVGDVDHAEVAEALAGARRRLARRITAVVYSRDEFQGELAEGRSYFAGILNGPRLLVTGDEWDLARLITGADETEEPGEGESPL